MIQPGDLIDDRYTVIEEIGRGGMGAVFRATDTSDGSEIALKCCTEDDETARRRFAREVRSMQGIQHQHVMPVLDASEDHDPPYFTMPLAASSLMDEVDAGLDEEAALIAFRELCLGIQALHNSGVTHRDIKPANAMRMRDGRMVVSDMGLAKLDPRDTTILTRTFEALGTHLYMAPEQWNPGGTRAADERTDVYQLGKTLYQLLTGEHPGLIEPSRLPVGLAYVVERATQNLPERRYASVGSLADAVKNYTDSRNPDSNPMAAFEADLAEAISLAESGKYREDNLESLANSILRFRSQPDELVSQYELVPDHIAVTLADKMPDLFKEVLNAYSNALIEVVSGYNFSHAELVGRKIRVVFEGASDPTVRALALRPLLVSAVILNRFAALDIFDSILTSVRDPATALAVSDVLRDNMHYYSQAASRIPRNKLDAALHAVFDAAT